MDILEIIDAKLSNISIPSAEKLLAIEEVELVIKNYCNINNVPEELKFTWANMTIDLLRYQHESNLSTEASGNIDDINIGDVSSLKIGDTSVNLGSGSISNAHNIAMRSHYPNLDEIIMNYKSQLQRFRKMVW